MIDLNLAANGLVYIIRKDVNILFLMQGQKLAKLSSVFF